MVFAEVHTKIRRTYHPLVRAADRSTKITFNSLVLSNNGWLVNVSFEIIVTNENVMWIIQLCMLLRELQQRRGHWGRSDS